MLSLEEKRLLLRLARSSIQSRWQKDEKVELSQPSPAIARPCGAFVSLHLQHRLRGCMGRVHSEQPLWETVCKVACEAAFSDPRFPPLRPEELPHVEIEISVLSPLELVENLEDIQVGRDGLLIVHGAQRGLLLPQVATQYGWDRETFLAHTARKAGLPSDIWRKGAKVYRFQAEVFGEKDCFGALQEEG